MSEADAGVDFLPGEGHGLEVSRVVVRHRVIVGITLDCGGVVELHVERDVALPAWEGLLLLGEGAKERFLLDRLCECRAFDVVI